MNIHLLLLTVFGLGHIRIASGTWGSMPAVGLALMLVFVFGQDDDLSAFEHISISVSVALVGLLFSVACVKFGKEGEQAFGKKDPGQIVADEMAGQSVALLALPWRALNESQDWWWNLTLAATAFLAFRILDIIKPPPAYKIQNLKGGWGVLADDLVAGFYALIIVQIVGRLILPEIGWF